MHRLAIKRTTKKRSAPKSQYTCNGVCRAASRHSAVRCDRRYVCRDCRLQCTCRGVRTANLHAVRSAITATAELLVTLAMAAGSLANAHCTIRQPVLTVNKHGLHKLALYRNHSDATFLGKNCIGKHEIAPV